MTQDTGFIFACSCILHPASRILRLASCILFIATASVRATDYTSARSGNWHDAGTWGAGGYPNAAVDNVTILASHTVTVAEAATAYTVSNLTVNGGLTHTTNNAVTTPHYRIDLTIRGDLVVNGVISADGKGYTQFQGPAPGEVDHGGRHGGLGGANSEAYANLYPTYGSLTDPTTLGSGGGDGTGWGYYIHGGGAVILRVSGTTTVNGGARISAEGVRSSNFASAGAGGSVNLRTGTLGGSGVIQANGGLQDPGGNVRYAGGGGRVAVRLTAGDSFGSVTNRAWGGYGNYANNKGAAGTVYLQTLSQGEGNGTVIIDDGGWTAPGFVRTEISSNVTETTVGGLLVTNSAVFTIGSNATFTVLGNLLNYGQSASLGAGGTFRVGGSGTCTIGGSVGTTRFHHFTCTNAGKRIEFQTGRTNQLDGVLTLAGTAGNEVKLAGLGSGTWGLKVPSPFAGNVSYVDVTNSDANAGATIAAYNSLDRGGNRNWSFATPGQVNLWTGATSTNWGVAGNWSLGRLPVGTDVIRITTANNPARWPVLNDHATLQTLQVEAGAKLSLGGKNLTVGADFDLAGVLVASGSETVTLQGDADWTGGTLSNAQSTVVIGGTGAQALVFGGMAFNKLVLQNPSALTLNGSFAAVAITNAGGTVSFANAFTAGSLVNEGSHMSFGAGFGATNVVCRRPGVTLTFKNGATCAVTNLTLAGSAASPVSLVSAVPGAKWNLNVSGGSHVSRVTVSDSDASGGLTIRPVASAEGTPSSTVNWNFGSGTWKTWTGGTASFTNANNWNPTGVPDAGSRLYVESTAGVAAPVLGTTQTVGELAVGGVSNATAFLNGPLTVTGRVAILPGGTLTHSNNATTALFNLRLTVGGDLEIAPGGAIDVTGKGFQSYGGPAPGVYGGSPWYGAGHGGMGGHEDGHVASPYLTYGSVTDPITLGSGGATSGGNETPGGGAAIVRVGGQTYINQGGSISANVPDAPGFWRGGGAGGSVNLVTATLAGDGVIQAHGGRGTVVGGGGGRVAVRLTSGNSFGGVAITAYGGLDGYINGTRYGAAGTVYRQTASQGEGNGDLIIDNNGYSTPADVHTLISTNVTDTTVGNVTVTGRGRLWVGAYAQLSAGGSLTNAANTTVTTATNSTVAFVGSQPATVWGNQSFHNLSILGAGLNKPLTFEAGREVKVAGALRIDRAALGSSVPGTQWYLTLDLTNGTQPVVARTMVQDSNASRGQTISITTAARDLGNNVNWVFAPGGTVLVVR